MRSFGGDVSNISISVDLTPWLNQLYGQLDAILADLAHSVGAINEGSYTSRASGQQFGLVTVEFRNNEGLAASALKQATERAFLAAVSHFISFLDRLIAS